MPIKVNIQKNKKITVTAAKKGEIEISWETSSSSKVTPKNMTAIIM